MTIAIVMPTLSLKKAEATAHLAALTAGCDTRIIISVDTERRGFSKTVNYGLRQTKREDVCILNDDIAWFTPAWLEVLRRVAHFKSHHGVVGPSGRSSTAPMRHGWPGLNGLAEVHHLPFWCVLVKRKAFDLVGYLDEAFIHYGSDNWFCRSLFNVGMACIWCRNVYLEHEHHGSGLIQEWKDHDDLVMLRKKRRRKRR